VIVIFAPAAMSDLMAFLAPRLTVPRRIYRHLVAQMVGGPVWVVRHTSDGPPLAIGGVYRFGDARPAQAWLLIKPELRGNLAAVAGRARSAFREARDGGPIVAIARTRAGARIARALGFSAVDDSGVIWRMT